MWPGHESGPRRMPLLLLGLLCGLLAFAGDGWAYRPYPNCLSFLGRKDGALPPLRIIVASPACQGGMCWVGQARASAGGDFLTGADGAELWFCRSGLLRNVRFSIFYEFMDEAQGMRTIGSPADAVRMPDGIFGYIHPEPTADGESLRLITHGAPALDGYRMPRAR